MNEAQKYQKAFDTYYKLGTERSLRKLHQYYSKNTPDAVPSIDTFKNWSKKYRWQERVMLRDQEITKNVEKRILKEEEDIRIDSYNNVKQLGDTLLAVLGTAFYKDEKDGGKRKIRTEN